MIIGDKVVTPSGFSGTVVALITETGTSKEAAIVQSDQGILFKSIFYISELRPVVDVKEGDRIRISSRGSPVEVKAVFDVDGSKYIITKAEDSGELRFVPIAEVVAPLEEAAVVQETESLPRNEKIRV